MTIAKPSGKRGDNSENERPAEGQLRNRAAFGRTIAKPTGLRKDNSETERPAEGNGEAQRQATEDAMRMLLWVLLKLMSRPS